MANKNNYTAAEGKPGKLLSVRLAPGCDLVQGIIDACKAHGIKSGGITNLLGSLSKVKYKAIAKDESIKTGAGFVEVNDIQGPVEFLSGQGIICEEDGEMFIHLHGVMSDINHHVFGGHIERGDCKVLNTFELIISEAKGFTFSREMDAASGMVVSFPRDDK
jgi:hypothetical protein